MRWLAARPGVEMAEVEVPEAVGSTAARQGLEATAALAAAPRLVPAAPWSGDAAALQRALASGPEGLSEDEARRRLAACGANRVARQPRAPAAAVLGRQFRGWMAGLLLGAAVLALGAGQPLDAAAIALVLLFNAFVGFAAELRGVRSMEALERLVTPTARVRREGRARLLPAAELVPGDLVVVEAGDVVPADARVLTAANLEVDESALTGESLPVLKRTVPLAVATALADRANTLFQGTAVVAGTGDGLVVATGPRTELGGVTALAGAARHVRTPLERQLAALGRRLIVVVLALAGGAVAVGLAAGRDPLLMIELGVSLAVAAIPEGLPIVATMALARAAHRMARQRALVRRLAAVETVGAVSLVLTDKTGTLTENRVTAELYVLADGERELVPGAAPDPRLREALTLGALCSNAELPAAAPAAVGEPLERALLEAAAVAGIHRGELLRRLPEVREDAFTAERRLMATVHRSEAGYLVAVKGAAEEVLAAAVACRAGAGDRPLDAAERRRWLERARALAADGLRVLALATKHTGSAAGDPFAGLTLVALVGLADPPRRDVALTLAALRAAGIRVAMVTGDHAETARHVAAAVGLIAPQAPAAAVSGRDLAGLEALPPRRRRELLDAPIFARVSPAEKLALVRLAQRHGEVVAMLGDGVNDAPALRQADVGVAMGERGTQVAREAADIVLGDDALATLVAAVRQGRAILANLRTFMVYLLSCNLSEILLVAAAAAAAAPLAVLPLQILFLNLVTDVLPALALGLAEPAPDVLRRPPRDPRRPLLERRHWRVIAGWGLAITVSPLLALGMAVGPLGRRGEAATSISFLALALAQLVHVFNLRGRRSPLWRNEITRNPHVWAALVACLALLAAAVYLPALARPLRLVAPDASGWLAIVAAVAVPWTLVQALKGLAARRPAPAERVDGSRR